MRVAWFEAEQWEREYLEALEPDLEIEFFEEPLNTDNAGKAEGFDAAAVFVNSEVDGETLEQLDIDLLACRSTGYDHVDLEAAGESDISVFNVPEYGSCTVAEHTMGLMLTLSRRIYYGIKKVESGNFSHEGLRGFDLKGKKIGVIGTGSIGREVIKRSRCFGMDVIASDPYPDKDIEKDLGFEYVDFDRLIAEADVISLHCPLTEETRHMLSAEEFNRMDSTLVINTARGELIDTEALIEALENGNVSAAGLDVLEDECYITEDIAVQELEDECDIEVVLDDHILIERDDVLVTPHNAFNSVEALQRIVDTTLDNLERRSNPVIR